MVDIERIRKMARKVRKVDEVALMDTQREEVQPDNGVMALTELEMVQLMLHEQRVEMNRLQSEKFALQEQLLNLEYVKNRDTLRLRQRECIGSMERAKDDYNTVRAAVQARLGVNLDQYTVNEAGQLQAAPQIDN
jgi:hypothetical protein